MYLSVMSHTHLINLWPSLSDFASDLSIQYGTAKAMRRRGSVPPVHWPVMVEKARGRRLRGVTIRSLALAAASKETAGAA